jgi:hypothetical protein
MEVKYLNTDLDIESKQDLSGIIEEFCADVLVLHHGEIRGYQHAAFEIAGSCSDADGTINYFCALIEGLPKEVREIWNDCCSRILDIGYESGTFPNNFRSEIRPSTIQRVAEIGASIVITIYPLLAEDSTSGNTNL